MSPRDLLVASMGAALRDEPYEAARHLDDYAMLRSHGAGEPTIALPWEDQQFPIGGDHFARYVRGLMKLDAEYRVEPDTKVIVFEKPTCDCLAKRDCQDSKGDPKGGIDSSSLGIREFRYSDMSTRHWNKHARGWISSCRRTCPAAVALLAKTGFRLSVA